jgi:uncharacterized BrkB/YihY/UPF0761 family membrane protein
MKKLLTLIFEPIKAFSNRNVAEKISQFFSKNKWLAFVVALVVTLVMFILYYVLPNV